MAAFVAVVCRTKDEVLSLRLIKGNKIDNFYIFAEPTELVWAGVL